MSETATNLTTIETEAETERERMSKKISDLEVASEDMRGELAVLTTRVYDIKTGLFQMETAVAAAKAEREGIRKAIHRSHGAGQWARW